MPTSTTLTCLLLAAATAASAASTGPRSAASGPVVLEALQYTEATEVDAAEWLERLFGIELGPAERRCASNRTLLHGFTNRCYDLYHQGPCRAWEWFVGDRAAATAPRRPRRLRGVCARRPCAPGYGFHASDRRCRPADVICPPDRHFEYNLFGEGHCQCKGFRAAPRPGARCAPLFEEGGCGEGRVLVPRFDLTGAFSGQCVKRNCSDGKLLLERPGKVPECRSLDEADCIRRVAGLFTAETDLKAFLCVSGDRAVAPVPSRPAGCAVDNSGRCAKTFIRSEEPYDWFLEEAEDGPRLMDEPAADEPAADEPAADEPAADEPAAGEPDPMTTSSSSSSASTAYLERYLSPYALFSLIFF